MRLWHKDLIQDLPKQQLVGQWRELALISKNIQEKGTPNHILVNKIMEYPLDHFYTYCNLIERELWCREYKVKLQSRLKIFKEPWNYVDTKDLFKDWHNDRYLRQCLFNLEEKYDCGGISEEEWKPLQRIYNHEKKWW